MLLSNGYRNRLRLSRALGFTLVELLVVISIIGLLMSLTLPAIQASREAGRMTVCQNKLAQLAKATIAYRSATTQYPTGGWGPTWIGHPPGQSEKQPGGWIYQLLPYIEEDSLQKAEGAAGNKQRAEAVLASLYCPTRRQPEVIPYSAGALLPSISGVTLAGRTDYAANSGSGTTNLDLTTAQYPQANPPPGNFSGWVVQNNTVMNGAVVQRTPMRDINFGDGTGRTYLYGEKLMDRQNYDTGNDAGDKYPALTGFGSSIMRSTAQRMESDRNGIVSAGRFGSAHPSGANFAFADGTVRIQDYGIDVTVFQQLGNRNDGGPLNEGDYIK